MDRRTFVLASAALTATPAFAAAADPFAALEARHGGRLGVAALDTSTGARLAHRADEHFPMCSTFKLLVVGAILHNIDQGTERQDRFIGYGKTDLLPHSPASAAHLAAGGMTVLGMCEAAIEYGDNTAANFLLASVGGPTGATSYVRLLGDAVTRIDRNEPTANTCIPGDPRDTTTPLAMLTDLRALTEGGVLSEDSQTGLTEMLMDCQTAQSRIPAGLPRGWTSGNKTGTGDHNTANDISIITSPNRPSIFVAAYYTGSTASPDEQDAVLADVGRIVAASFP
jgi:beta-lactamase class A